MNLKQVFLGTAGFLVCSATVAMAGGMVAAWDFDDGPGATVVKDKVGKAHGEALELEFEPSDIGEETHSSDDYSGVFNGLSSKVVVEPGAENRWAGFWQRDFTLTGWVQLPRNEKTNDIPVITADKNRARAGWTLQVGRADRTRKGRLFFTVGASSDGKTGIAVSENRVDDGRWHWFAVVVRDATIHLYVDGLFQGASPCNPESLTTAGEAIVFGNRGDTYFQGKMDRVRLYDYALSDSLDSQRRLLDSDLYQDWKGENPSAHH